METRAAIAQRWSARAYLDKPIPDADLKTIFEASRAAHSCFNEQPWHFLFAKKNAGAHRIALESLLDQGNDFAKNGWVLGVSFAKKTFAKTGGTNRHAGHDLGSASQLMSLLAFSLGYSMRFMGGYDLEKARTLAPADFEPYAMFVLGVPDLSGGHPERSRNKLTSLVFENAWGNPVLGFEDSSTGH